MVEYQRRVKRTLDHKTTCLSCGKDFLSEGKQNRICDKCKRVNALLWEADSYNVSLANPYETFGRKK